MAQRNGRATTPLPPLAQPGHHSPQATPGLTLVTSNSNPGSEAAIRHLMRVHGIDRYAAIALYLKQRLEGLG